MLKVRMNEQPTDLAGAVMNGCPDRPNDLTGIAHLEKGHFIEFFSDFIQGLGQRRDKPVLIYGSLALICQFLKLQYFCYIGCISMQYFVHNSFFIDQRGKEGHLTYFFKILLRPAFSGFTVRMSDFSSDSRNESPPKARPVRS